MQPDSSQPGVTIAELVRQHRPGYALDQRFYTDPDIYRLELPRILLHHWFLAGHVSELAEAGDFLVARMDKESAIIVRGDDGQVRAFANVCRHRGSLICLQDAGSVRKFECPYHGWMYDLEGKLVAARSMPADFDKSGFGLRPLSLQVVGGFIFVSFNDQPPSFDATLAKLREPMDLFGFDNLKVIASKVYEIPANWKLAIENYQECYHCASAHSDYAKMHTLMLDPVKRDRMQHKMQQRFAACGMRNIFVDHTDVNTLAGQSPCYYARTALFEGYQTGSRSGEAVAPLLGKLTGYDGGASDWVFGPLTYVLAYSDYVVAYVFVPTGHDACICKVWWLLRADAVEGADYQVDDVTWLWTVTTESDKEIIVNNWRGVQSRYYRPGRFSTMENMESRYVQWLIGELGD